MDPNNRWVDPVATTTRAKVDLARAIIAEYNADPGTPDPEIRVVEDLYDTATGMPRP
ncbi:hypothetical protein [Nocardioides sp. AE5]|uniref:hypothetical protein n=1 Tax=Nocardioides sp. AE5 TaxID=2962573 RepID=UPI00288163E2|nr:hypothetical protein [Nocardioides sp. AE5]MDT0202469.1 hypothetical protein [Nocardioides sp. AE5]